MELFIDASREIYDAVYYVKLFKLHESFLLLISTQKEMGIGSVYLGIPSTIEGIKPSTGNYGLFGIGRELLGKVISERFSLALKAPVLLLLFIKTPKKDEEILKPLMEFLNELFKDKKLLKLQ